MIPNCLGMAIIAAIMKLVKGAQTMIRYDPLWKTMAKKKATTYTLRVTFGMSHATVQRLQSNLPVTTHTLDKLCKSLDCRLEAVSYTHLAYAAGRHETLYADKLIREAGLCRFLYRKHRPLESGF